MSVSVHDLIYDIILILGDIVQYVAFYSNMCKGVCIYWNHALHHVRELATWPTQSRRRLCPRKSSWLGPHVPLGHRVRKEIGRRGKSVRKTEPEIHLTGMARDLSQSAHAFDKRATKELGTWN